MANDEVERVEFLASFPPIQSAIKIDGSGGARIQLDVPEIEVGNFIKAMMWRQQRLKVIIEPYEAEQENDRRTAVKSRKIHI